MEILSENYRSKERFLLLDILNFQGFVLGTNIVQTLFIRSNKLGNVGNLDSCGFRVHKPHILWL